MDLKDYVKCEIPVSEITENNLALPMRKIHDITLNRPI